MEHESLVRAILMEAVKKGTSNVTLYRMMQTLANSENLTNQEKEHMVNEFFFNIIPCIAYICFKDSWIQFFQMEESLFNETFLSTYSHTHIESHKNLPTNE